MVDSAISRVRLPMDLVSLLLYLVMMDTLDLVMMISNWEVAIKSGQKIGGRHCS